METIPKAECQKIGFIRKMHGVHGDLVLEFEPEFEWSVAEAKRFLLEIDGLLVPFFLKEDEFRFKSTKTAIVSFLWVENEKYARRLVGCPVFLFNSEIVDEAEEQLVSKFLHFTLADEKLGEIGTITASDDFSGNVVFHVQYKGDEILIPFNEDFLVSKDSEKKVITLRLPDGLIDL
jgi:16S rRNA processing protein RimM